MLQRLVVKPDQLIKRRGKLGLVGINLTLDQVKVWLKQRLGQETTVSGIQQQKVCRYFSVIQGLERCAVLLPKQIRNCACEPPPGK